MNHQDLQLPTAFLLDTEGRIVKVYRERVDVPLILQDAPKIEASPAERLARALPFEGTFYSAPGRRDYVPYGRDLLDQGLEAQAVVAFEYAAQGKPSASILYRLGSLLVKTGQKAEAKAALRAGARDAARPVGGQPTTSARSWRRVETSRQRSSGFGRPSRRRPTTPTP